MTTLAGMVALLAIGQMPVSRQVVPKPTGQNGYEEYLAAVDIVAAPAYREFKAWRAYRDAARSGNPQTDERGRPRPAPKAPAGLTLASTELEIRRYASCFFPEALRLIKIGNRKHVQDPRATVDAATLFPELAEFKTLANLAVDSAYVSFAEGSPKSGADALLETLVMSNQVQGTTLIQTLVGFAAQAIILAGFDRHLQMLPYEECRRIDQAVTELLTRPPGILLALQGERRFTESVLVGLLAGKPTGFDEEGQDAEAIAWIRTLSPRQREEAKRAIGQRLDAVFDPAISRLKGPEVNWYKDFPVPESNTTEEPTSIKSLQDLLRLADMMIPIYDGAVEAAGRHRTQLRLLQLHMRILAHRWREGGLPSSLDAVTTPEERQDPFSGGEFRYALTESGGYRVYSAGTGKTGEVDLRYKRPQATQGDPSNP